MGNAIRINAPEPSQWQAIVESFLLKKVSGRSSRTIDDYTRYLYAFFHLSIQGRTVNVHAAIAKTRTARVSPISDATAAAVDKLHARSPRGMESIAALLHLHGRATHSQQMVHPSVRRMQKSRSPHISPYDLRHGFTLLYLKSGGDAFSLKDIMGYSTMTMTSRYVAFSGEDVQEAHARFSPMNALRPQPVKRMGKIR